MSPWKVNCHLGDPLKFTCFSLFFWTSKSKRWIMCWLSQCFNPCQPVYSLTCFHRRSKGGSKDSLHKQQWIDLSIALDWPLQLHTCYFNWQVTVLHWLNPDVMLDFFTGIRCLSCTFVTLSDHSAALWQNLTDSLCQWLSSYPWTDSYRQLLSMQNEDSGMWIWYCDIVTSLLLKSL